MKRSAAPLSVLWQTGRLFLRVMQHTQGGIPLRTLKHDVDIIYDPIIYAVAD